MADGEQQDRSREGLLRNSREQHAALEALLAGLSEEEMTRPGVTDDWSVKDHLAHVTWWEQRVIRMLVDGAPDPIDAMPGDMRSADGIDEDKVNAVVRAANRNRPLADVRTDFDASYAEMLTLIETVPDDVLAQKYDWISGNADYHYDEHARMLRAWRERI